MIAAVCCPGPSLPDRWPGRAGYAEVWAVNRALLAVPDADWLAAGDVVLYQNALLGEARPRVGCLTMPDSVQFMGPSWGRVVLWDQVPAIAVHRRRGAPINWSVQSALCHAAWRGATRIDLYGCDNAASGTPVDCTGYAGEARTAERWEREERDLAITFALLAESRVTIHRIAPPQRPGADR